MAIFSLTDALIAFDGYDLTGYSNSLNLEASVEELDGTTFGTNGWRSRVGGLKTTDFNATGFINLGTGEVEEGLFNNLASSSSVLTVAPTDAVGDPAFLFQAMHSNFTHRATVGELAGWDMTAQGRSTVGTVRGKLLAATTVTATGTGTAVLVGAASATQDVYASLHVVDVSGTTPTLDVVVQSDDGSGFASPTSRITFSQATAQGVQWGSAAGAITDTYYRVSYTVGGTSPSFTFVVAVGVA